MLLGEKVDKTGQSPISTRYCLEYWSAVEEQDGDDPLQATYVNGGS